MVSGNYKLAKCTSWSTTHRLHGFDVVGLPDHLNDFPDIRKLLCLHDYANTSLLELWNHEPYHVRHWFGIEESP